VTAFAVALVWIVQPSLAEQTSEQQKCLNDLTKNGANVVRHQNKANLRCLKDASRGKTSNLGDEGETLTAQACLTNDVGGKVAKKQEKTVTKDNLRCTGSGTPDWAYEGAATINTAASAESVDIVADIFGPDLGLALVDYDLDRDGAGCQEEILRGAYRILDDMWKLTRGAIKDGLAGRNRLAGADPDSAAHSRANLQGEILSQSFADPKGKVQAEYDRLLLRAQSRCVNLSKTLAEMFPGICSGAATVTDLVDCIDESVRAHFYRTTASFYGMQVECDLTDDGRHDESCVSTSQQRHLLDRLGFGPDAHTIGRILALGLGAYIEEQLDPDALDDSTVDGWLSANYPSLDMTFNDLRLCYPQDGGTCPGLEGYKKNDVPKELQESEILRAVASRRQLQGVLVDFWYNHYNVAGDTGRRKWDTTPYVRESIRPWVLGDFEEGVVRMTRGPAMLDYLDQRQNQVGVPPGTGYNENFSRELFELHTLSVTGPYTEADVKEAARALTGWREDYDNDGPGFEYNGFRYQDSRHDYLGPKTVLGATIDFPADGEQEGFEVLALAAQHPSTAEFVCTKLVKRFVGEAPPFALVEECVATFLAFIGNADQIKEMMRTLLESKEFLLYPEYRRSKVKRPYVLFSSSVRTFGLDPDPAVVNYSDLRRNINGYGEELRNAGPPTGYPDSSQFWASPGAIVLRFNDLEKASRQLAGGLGVLGSGTSSQVVDDLIAVFFPLGGVSSQTRTAAIDYLDAIPAPTDPERVEQGAAFLLSSPEFLSH
jgi:hypothetical protein